MTHITSSDEGADVKTNPLLRDSDLPYGLFPFADLKEEHFLPAFDHVAAQVRTTLDSVLAETAEPTFANTVEPLERAGVAMNAVLGPFFTLTGADTTPGLQQIEEALAPRIAELEDSILVNRNLFERIAALRDDASLTPEQAHIVERRLKDMSLAGADLGDSAADEVRELNSKLAVLNAEFGRRLLADTTDLTVQVDSREELDGLTDVEIEALAVDGGGYAIALTYPTGHPYLARLTNRGLRERIMRASLARCSRGNENDTRDLIAEVATLRARRAALLGFANHAAWATAAGTAKTTDAVLEMFTPVARAAGEMARREVAALQELASKDGIDELEPWDHAYYVERVRAAEYDVDLEALRPYFELERVLTHGVFGAARRLYGLTFEPRRDLSGWNGDTRVFEVFDENSNAVGLYLLDPYARPSKRGGAWMHSLRDQNTFCGHSPVICNNLNVPKPPAGSPALMTYDEVETFFHEFGHALHGLLSNVRYPSVSGTAVERDFVEFPSQVNEMWMLDPSIVKDYARHIDTGEPLPSEVLAKIEASSTFNQGFLTSELVSAALFDFHWHLLADGEEAPEVMSFMEDIRRAYGLDTPAVPSRYALPYFQHIFDGGYAAGYYGYLWSEVLDADAGQWFAENGGATRENGQRFAEAVLSVGGSTDPLAAYETFRGRAADPAHLLRRRGLARPVNGE